MNITNTTLSNQVTVDFPHDAQNLLIRRLGNDYLEVPIKHGVSVLNLETELHKHLTAYPFTDEWLTNLRDFVDAQLKARRIAKERGGFAIPHPTSKGFAVVTDFPLMRERLDVSP